MYLLKQSGFSSSGLERYLVR